MKRIIEMCLLSAVLITLIIFGTISVYKNVVSKRIEELGYGSFMIKNNFKVIKQELEFVDTFEGKEVVIVNANEMYLNDFVKYILNGEK
jgi:hypothetical protein